ncbi:MAG: hypothetical protein EA400_14330 [Chromatiaceae bacterium]|nr:MAG: hypothetical protein EA400_14330 [Chromatiaceae bacterium]
MFELEYAEKCESSLNQELDQEAALRAELLDEARAIMAAQSHKPPTRLHLWALISALDGSPLEPPPTVYGQMTLPFCDGGRCD